MATTDTLITTPATTPPPVVAPSFIGSLGRGVWLAVIVGAALFAVAALLQWVFHPALASVGVQENFTDTLAGLLIGLLPIACYIAGGSAARRIRKNNFVNALLAAWIVAALAYGLLIAYQYATGTGAFREASTLGFAMRQTDAGIEVVSVKAGSSAEEAGLQVGDIITALRRDPVTADDLQTRIAQAALDDAFRLRLTRNGEELQLTTRVQLESQTDVQGIFLGLIAALVISLITLVLPTHWVPHMLLLVSMLPLFVGYLWLIIATFSERTNGILPVDVNGNLGGWTLSNWDFLNGKAIGGPTVDIFTVTINSLVIAVAMTIASLVISSMAGYALSRMMFPGRKGFLSMTLVLHGFPAVTLIIPIFLVLINLGGLPVIGKLIGYNTTGGIAMVMIAFELPLGIWLMKGFFDSISWDMERSALIDGASRWRTFWEIILPQIRPGLLALGIFSFISGWNAYLIPATYSVGTGLATLPVYIRQLTGELAAVNWNQVAAVGIFQLIPIFIFFIFAQEYLLNIYAGGTKGSS